MPMLTEYNDDPPEERGGLALKLLRDGLIIDRLTGGTPGEVRDALIAWLDEAAPGDLHGLTVQKYADRFCTLTIEDGGVVLTTSKARRVFDEFGAARDAFADYAVRGDGFQWA